jgi:hypothetical protein
VYVVRYFLCNYVCVNGIHTLMHVPETVVI